MTVNTSGKPRQRKIVARQFVGHFGDSLFSILMGLTTTQLVLGIERINPSNVSWLYEGDSAQRYIGWEFYRSSGFEKGLFANPDYGMEIASSIAYTDSLPLLALVAKILTLHVDSPFQYIGIWVLISMILQSFFAQRLLGLWIKKKWLSRLLSIFFAFAPPMLHRIELGQESLVGHFLILAGLWLYFSRPRRNTALSWTLLISISLLTHPYFFVMVLGIWAARQIRPLLLRAADYRKILVGSAPVIAATSLLLWQLGYFSGGLRDGGYGKFKLNVAGPLDSNGWSYFLPDLEGARPGEVEGFAFLGAGIILLLAVSVSMVLFRSNNKFLEVRSHIGLLALICAFALFSVSNNFAIGPYEASYNLPDETKAVFDTFRASGRFVWPIYYLVMLATILFIWKNLARKTLVIIVSLALTLQIVDTNSGWGSIKESIDFRQSLAERTSLDDVRWSEIAGSFSSVRVLRDLDVTTKYWREVGFFALDNGLSTDAAYLARWSSNGVKALKSERERLLSTGIPYKGSFYIVEGAFYLKEKERIHNIEGSIEMIDGYIVLLPPIG